MKGDSLSASSSAESDTIWHFTGPDTLYEILKPKGGLLASHAGFLNDPSDLELSRRALRLIGKHFDQTMPSLHAQHPSWGQSLKQETNRGLVFPGFVCCFCNTIHNPLMWRAYTPDGGFAIGFKRECLVSAIKADKRFDFDYGLCDYDAWDSVAAEIDELDKSLAEDRRSPTYPLLIADHKREYELFAKIQQLSRKAARVKNEFFRDEKEFRLVFFHRHFPRLSDCFVLAGIPRISIPLKPGTSWASMVDKIVVSPLGNTKRNLAMARFVLQMAGIEMHRVEPSEDPIRSPQTF